MKREKVLQKSCPDYPTWDAALSRRQICRGLAAVLTLVPATVWAGGDDPAIDGDMPLPDTDIPTTWELYLPPNTRRLDFKNSGFIVYYVGVTIDAGVYLEVEQSELDQLVPKLDALLIKHGFAAYAPGGDLRPIKKQVRRLLKTEKSLFPDKKVIKGVKLVVTNYSPTPVPKP
ncbi:MAG: hypothetical protein HN348_12205 [Proteobacteria bacterium]|nr:hypothetical protein [Pseudomonadota bacterium]